jgi:hypothetical protein
MSTLETDGSSSLSRPQNSASIPQRTYETGARHQLTLMCDDIATTVEDLRGRGVDIRGEPEDEGWGITTTIVLPGGVDIMLYEPRHPTAI